MPSTVMLDGSHKDYIHLYSIDSKNTLNMQSMKFTPKGIDAVCFDVPYITVLS
jgi:hypothetical protein